jgi:hypothetical protein
VVLCKNISSRIAWRWPNSVAETWGYKYNKTPVNCTSCVDVIYSLCIHIWLLQHNGNGMCKCKERLWHSSSHNLNFSDFLIGHTKHKSVCAHSSLHTRIEIELSAGNFHYS